MNPREPLRSLTGVRAVAALWVVLFHFRNNVGITESLSAAQVVQRGYLGVDVFFVLSGLVLAYTYEPRFENGVTRRQFVDYLLLRLGRIYPLHFVVFGAYLAVFIAGMVTGFTPLDPRITGAWDAAMSLLLLHAWGFTHRLAWNEASWSISAEWFAYLFLLLPLVRGCRLIAPAFLVAVTAVAWLTLCYFAQQTERRTLDFTYEFGAFRCGIEFFAGYVIYRIWSQWRLSGTTGDVLAALSTIALVLGTWLPGVEVWLLPCLMVFFLGLMGRGPIAEMLLGNRTMVFLGEISYAIYMVHLLVRILSNAVLRKLDYEPSVFLASALLAAQLAAVLVMATIAYYLVERPAREWVRRTRAA